MVFIALLFFLQAVCSDKLDPEEDSLCSSSSESDALGASLCMSMGPTSSPEKSLVLAQFQQLRQSKQGSSDVPPAEPLPVRSVATVLKTVAAIHLARSKQDDEGVVTNLCTLYFLSQETFDNFHEKNKAKINESLFTKAISMAQTSKKSIGQRDETGFLHLMGRIQERASPSQSTPMIDIRQAKHHSVTPKGNHSVTPKGNHSVTPKGNHKVTPKLELYMAPQQRPTPMMGRIQSASPSQSTPILDIQQARMTCEHHMGRISQSTPILDIQQARMTCEHHSVTPKEHRNVTPKLELYMAPQQRPTPMFDLHLDSPRTSSGPHISGTPSTSTFSSEMSRSNTAPPKISLESLHSKAIFGLEHITPESSDDELDMHPPESSSAKVTGQVLYGVYLADPLDKHSNSEESDGEENLEIVDTPRTSTLSRADQKVVDSQTASCDSEDQTHVDASNNARFITD